MDDQLELLLADGIIDEVLGRLKSGKEANVSLVRRGDAVLAAKVYKDRETRSFKNNADYKEGRKVRNSRTQRAIDNGGKFGRDADMQAWKSTEADALYKLAGSGVRIPAAVMFYEGVLLMELVLDAEGRPAPRMIDVSIDQSAALGIYADLVAQLISMLCCDVIHGDLSPYNILAAADGPTIIDFPQMVSAVHSSRAEFFFLRDFDNIVKFMAGFDPSLAVHTADGRAIWRAYVSRELTPEFVPPPPPPPRPTRGPDRRGPPPQRGSWQRPQNGPGRGPQSQSENGRGPQQSRGTDQRGSQQSRGTDQRGPQPPRGTDQQSQSANGRGSQSPRGNDQRGSQPPRGNDQGGPQPSQYGNGRDPQPPRSNDRGPQQSRGPQPPRGDDQSRGYDQRPQNANGRGPQPPRSNERGPQPQNANGRGPQPPRGNDRGPQQSRGNDQRGPQPSRGSDQRSPQPPRGNDRGPQPSRSQQPPHQALGAAGTMDSSLTPQARWPMPPPKADAPAPSRGGRRRPKRRY